MSKLTCPIVRDLLPLYIDQVVSPETAQAVEDHLEGCPDCRGEYESLKADLPVLAEEMDTSRQFGDMMKKVKKKETLRILLAVVLLAAAMSGYFWWLQSPVIDNTGVTVYGIYEVKDPAAEDIFVLLYTAPTYINGISRSIYEDQQTGKKILQVDMLRTPTDKEIHAYWETFDLVRGEAVDEVRLGDVVIWTRETNWDDPIPAYVHAFLAPGAESAWSIELDGKENFTAYPAPFVMEFYSDGREIVWDLDGNVLCETP
ncbi:MAG: zf-HC2 domain-containing protein [Ruminiclostridium sp.]|nr:zf-HC2 domain-containing protein [Ruminiclostridium sp.]